MREEQAYLFPRESQFSTHTMKSKSSKKSPWEKPAPKSAAHHKLTGAQKQKAKASAKRAGRPYPNLVDNMKVVEKSAGKK